MTAIVGILNRRGLAFAADSAATHSSPAGYKISNNANKIFSLSKYHPVGVSIYNNLDFMGVPWDSIIKQFRDSQKNNKYNSLCDYIPPFWIFVKTYCEKVIQQEQNRYISLIVQSYYQEVSNLVKDAVGADINNTNAEQYFNRATDILDGFYSKFISEKAEDFENYDLMDFIQHAREIIDATIAPLVSNEKCPANFKDKFCNSLFALICHNSHVYVDNILTGLVFFGYGENDVFPSLIEYKVTYAINGHIKYTLSQKFEIGLTTHSAVIAPFAQTDVVNTVIRAVEDGLRKKFYDNYYATLVGLRDEIVNQLSDANAPESFVDIFKNLDINKYAKDYQNGMDDYIDKSYILPLLDTVSFLDKEDLADMAESLVRMTCLKRHITTEEETVGGPVDVAIITKGDGFIWKKRKHYFDPTLNTHFFERNKE